MDGIEQPEAQELAEPGDRPQAGPRRGLRLRGRCADGQRPVAAPRVVVAQPRAVDCEALLHRGRGTPLGDTVAVRFGGDLRPHLRPGRLTLGSVCGAVGVPPTGAPCVCAPVAPWVC